MAFLRIVEVFPPILRESVSPGSGALEEGVAEFVKEVRSIRGFADLVLVASISSPGIVTLSTSVAASLLEKRAGVRAAPVIVARDSNRKEISSAVLGALAMGLRNLMLVWGDRAPLGELKNVYDFPSLSDLISEARRISVSAGQRCRLLAPVDLSLFPLRGARLARGRLSAGAELLLAQPPTTDPDVDFEEKLALLDCTDLRSRVLLGVFPFRDAQDVRRMEKRFGWRLPTSLKHRASSAGYDPVSESRAIVRRIGKEGLPGVYLSTRGSPSLAKRILG